MSASPTVESPAARDEALDVWAWRFDQATRAGLDLKQAEQVADSSGDLEQLRAMAAAGVSPDLIVKILT